MEKLIKKKKTLRFVNHCVLLTCVKKNAQNPLEKMVKQHEHQAERQQETAHGGGVVVAPAAVALAFFPVRSDDVHTAKITDLFHTAKMSALWSEEILSALLAFRH